MPTIKALARYERRGSRLSPATTIQGAWLGPLRLLIGIAVLAAGVLISLWGLFFVLCTDDEGSDVYIGDVDAQVVGVIALAVGLTLIWVAIRHVRQRLPNRDVD